MNRNQRPTAQRRHSLLSVVAFWLIVVAAVVSITGCGGGDPEDEPTAEPVDCKALRAIAPPPGKSLELPPECLL